MEKPGNIKPLLPGLANLGLDFRLGDTVFFGDREPPTLEELEERAAWIRREIAIHAARGEEGS